MIAVILWASILHLISAQGNQFSISPNSTTNQTQASAEACYANCQSCQTLSNQCEECFQPYFMKAQDGTCQFDPSYTLESSANQIMAGSAFIYTSESWGNIQQTDCQPNSAFLTAPLRILGPFTSESTVNYQRTVSVHQYIILTFELIKMGWDKTSSLNVTLYDQNNVSISSQIISHTPNIAKQILCSSTQIDQRFAVLFQIADISVTTLSASISFTGSGSWGIATWALITGACDSSCSNCSFSNDPTKCIGCNSFFIRGSDLKCSQCFTGFALATVNGVSTCQKCSIEYQNCNPGQSLCFYNALQSQINASDCTFASGGDYLSTYDVNTLQYPGSLFTVSGKPATYQCGPYSVVGLAQPGDSITRIFANMQLHYLISITFNIFVVDQTAATQNNLFIIILDNNILEATYIITTGVSNLCGNVQKEAFVTYSATKFYAHSNSNNVNLTITSNASNWGIRNMRLAFQVCDSTCLQCGQQGCVQCQGYFTLNNLKCSSCPSGYGFITSNQSSTCVQCTENCLSCRVSIVNNVTVTSCLQCTLPYFLFESKCVLRTNVAATIDIGKANSSWSAQASSPLTSNNTCSINLPSRNDGSKVSFTVSENKLTSLLSIPQVHYKKIVQFYLIKIDSWDETDLLQLYLNDLLVLSRNYSSFGNNICFNPKENDYSSFQSIEIEDSNSSLSVSFEVVTAVGTTRRFGVANFQLFPVGCEDCENYPFQYQIDYNYDDSLNVHVEFNRVYVNNNASLFQEIFWLLINGNKVDYSVTWNNSITYILESFPGSEVLNGNLTIICKYPELVQTDTLDTVSDKPFFTARLLQSGSYESLKVVDNNASYAQLTRYTPTQNANGVDGVRIFFEVVSRAVIYIGFAFFFIGCQTSCTPFMHNLQKIWLHIFVAALAAPSALRYAFVGFRETQDQNIAVHPSSWESGLPSELYYNTPSYFQQYYTDVGFFRNIYNIAIAFLILGIFSIVAHFVLGRCDFSRHFKDNVLWRHLRITFVKRPYFIFYSIVYYQYLTLIMACTLQFTGFTNQTNQGVFGGLNSAGAIVAFIFATIFPLAHFYYLQKKRKEMEEAKIEFANRYGEIFQEFLPVDVWVEESTGVTEAEQFYNLFRIGEIWWICIVATVLYPNPQGQCFLLMITNLVHLVIVLFTSLSQSLYYKLGKVFELAFFAGLEIIMLVCQSQQQTLTTRSLDTLGSVSIALLFAIIALSFLRSVYTFVKIYNEYKADPEHNKYANIKMRNEDYFSTKGEQPLPSERDN